MFKREVFSDHINIRDEKFNVDLYENFEEGKKYTALYELGSKYGKLPNYKRKALIFGNPNIEYKVTYRGKTSSRKTIDWSDIPLITEIKQKIEVLLDFKPTVCILQWYPNGKICIDYHKDKEMKPGTKIVGVSFGSTRTLSFKRNMGSILFSLISGSLYVMNPPSNDEWAHAILGSDTTEGRFSLTFRDY